MEHLTEWRDGAKNREIRIYHSLNKNKQKIIECEKKTRNFIEFIGLDCFFFFFIFHSKGDCLYSLFSSTSIACILIEVFNSNMVKTLHIYTVKTDDLYTSKYSYIYVYYILQITDWKHKKWDLTLHSGIVEMKATKKKIEIYVYVLNNKIDSSKLRARQRKSSS